MKLLNKIKTKEFLFSTLLYIALFLFLLYPYRDYDWGWHLSYGHYFFQTGQILKEDLFSWTMPYFRWVNHSWAYDLILYQLYNKFSFLGLSIAGALVSLLTFHLITKPFKLDIYWKAILGAIFAFLVQGVLWQGLRSQVIGYFLLSVLMYLLFQLYQNTSRNSTVTLSAAKGIKLYSSRPMAHQNDNKHPGWWPERTPPGWRNWLYLAFPLLFLAWANLHGTFLLGLAIFTFFVFSQLLFQILKTPAVILSDSEEYNSRLISFTSFRMTSGKRHLLLLLASYFLSIVVTFLNPYGHYIYLESLHHFASPLLKYILEWQPAQFNHPFTLTFFAYTSFLILGFALRRKLTDLPWMLTFSLFFYLSLTARRYIASMVVVTLPMLALMLEDLNFRLERFKVSPVIFLVAVLVALEIGLFKRVPDYHLLNYSFADYCYFGSKCSEGLTAYLQNHPPSGKGFNFYDWGGYLEGRGIKSQWFVDGRMHLWRRKGFEPFLDYQRMYYEGDLARFNSYNFDFYLGAKDSLLSQAIKTGQVEGSWQEAYSDEYADYFIKVKSTK